MSNPSVGYEIREAAAPDGGVVLELVVEGAVFARASASSADLDALKDVRGDQRDDVIATLRQALIDALKTQGQFVTISDPLEDPEQELRFSSRYIYRLRDNISTGVVWYNVTESTTGPESLPAVVRNKMRYAVHRKLTEPGSVARALVEGHK